MNNGRPRYTVVTKYNFFIRKKCFVVLSTLKAPFKFFEMFQIFEGSKKIGCPKNYKPYYFDELIAKYTKVGEI